MIKGERQCKNCGHSEEVYFFGNDVKKRYKRWLKKDVCVKCQNDEDENFDLTIRGTNKSFNFTIRIKEKKR